MKATAIEWARSTFNPWWGCEKVSPGCAKCYAETFAKRVGHAVWGAAAPRRFFGDKRWAEPRRWNAEAERLGEPWRVFCASMADVFEDRPDLVAERVRLWRLIEQTPHLDWLLLTKRPEALRDLLPWQTSPWPNVWLGTTAEDQKRADERIPKLLEVPAALRFLSLEPLLGPVDLRRFLAYERCEIDPVSSLPWPRRIGWVIVGGESGPGARPCDVAWIRDVVRQCRVAGVPVFVKQLGARSFNGDDHVGPWPVYGDGSDPREDARFRWKDPKGGDPSEWPLDLRVREVPTIGGAR